MENASGTTARHHLRMPPPGGEQTNPDLLKVLRAEEILAALPPTDQGDGCPDRPLVTPAGPTDADGPPHSTRTERRALNDAH